MTVWSHWSTLSNTILIKSLCVLSIEAPEADKWKVFGTDDKLLLWYIFQTRMFFIEERLITN